MRTLLVMFLSLVSCACVYERQDQFKTIPHEEQMDVEKNKERKKDAEEKKDTNPWHQDWKKYFALYIGPETPIKGALYVGQEVSNGL